jgi:hypothetical protein
MARQFDKAKVEAFLQDLSAVSRKHGITISACGCCCSPWLSRPDGDVEGRRYFVSDDFDSLSFHEPYDKGAA